RCGESLLFTTADTAGHKVLQTGLLPRNRIAAEVGHPDRRACDCNPYRAMSHWKRPKVQTIAGTQFCHTVTAIIDCIDNPILVETRDRAIANPIRTQYRPLGR